MLDLYKKALLWCYSYCKEYVVNKTLSVVLIVVACLVVLSGTYWYFAMRPQTRAPEQGEQLQAQPSQPAEALLQPPIQPIPEEEPKPAVIEEPVQLEVQAKEAMVPEEPIAEVPIEQPVLTNTDPLPPPIDPLLKSGLLKLPVSSAPKVPIPFAPEPPLVKASAEAETAPEEPVADDRELPVEETTIGEAPLVPAAMQDGQESPPEAASESGKVVLTPIAPQTPQIPTSRVEIDPEPLGWTIGTAVSFANFDLPALGNSGFSVQLDILKHTDTLFSFGGALEYERDGGENQLSVLAKGQWTFRKDEAFNIPLSISLGPTFFFGTSPEFGLTAKVLGGFSYEIVENLRFFYQAGIQAQWVITSPDFNFSFEPMRVGFSYSF